MRDAFASEMTALGVDPKLVLLSGDIGNRMFDNFKTKFEDRFYNCGVAEANMIGVAAGLALSGLRPFVYTINSFLTYRCYEQIRVDLCYHKAPVVLVGVGAGLCYASLGATHHSCEDIAALRALPNMTVVCPGDAWEVRAAIRAAFQHDSGPIFIRLGKKGEPTVHQQIPSLTLGKALPIRSGTQMCLLSTGNMLPTAIEVAESLSQKNISVQVLSFHTVKPLDEDKLKEIFAAFPLIVTLEEHSLIGGIGSAVAEWTTAQMPPPKANLLRLGTSDHFLHEAGEQDYARARYHLTPAAISEQILLRLEKLKA